MGRPEFKVDVVDRVEKLDDTGIRLVRFISSDAGAAAQRWPEPLHTPRPSTEF